MPILDIHSNEIEHHPDFPNNATVLNLEIGAGKNFFGKKYYPKCYLTEKPNSKSLNYPHFTTLGQDYESQECHYIDHFTDFNSLINLGARFQNIICCNPFGYGFGGEAYATEFFTLMNRLLIPGGSFHILASTRSGWGNYRNAKKYYGKLSSLLGLNFEISPMTSIGATHQYRTENAFTWSDLLTTTDPNEFYTFTKSA